MTSQHAPEVTDWNALARSRYTDPASARAALDACTTERARLSKAQTMLSVARNPRNRFDLRAEDVSPEVVALLEQTIADLYERVMAPVRKLARVYRRLEKQGHAQDTIWTILVQDHGARELGFGYGDGTYLRSLTN